MKDNIIGFLLWMGVLALIIIVASLLGVEGCQTDFYNGVCQ